MSVSRELLMRYHDGEVSEAEARSVEEAFEQEPALLEELEAYSELGSFLRALDDTKANAAQSFDVADDVLRALESAPPRARVHTLLPRVATWLSVGIAIAAGSVLVVRSWTAPPASPNGAHAADNGAEQAPLAAAPDNAEPDMSAALEEESKAPPATIESVDFGKSSGRVFVVSTDSSETPVVWMPDDGEPDDDDEDRSKSL